MSKKIKSVDYQLKRILSNQFAFIEDLYLHDETPKLDALFSFAIESEKQLIISRAKFSFSSSKGIFMVIEGSCFFEIEHSSWLELAQKDGRVKIDKYFAAHISSLTIGTVRGMLHAKTEQTIYNSIFIPVINVEDLIKEEIFLEEHSN